MGNPASAVSSGFHGRDIVGEAVQSHLGENRRPPALGTTKVCRIKVELIIVYLYPCIIYIYIYMCIYIYIYKICIYIYTYFVYIYTHVYI